MKTTFKTLVFLAVLTSHSAFADCSLVKEPLTSSGIAKVLKPSYGLYEDMGARLVTREDGTKVFEKSAILISDEGVKVGVTIYPNLHESYVSFEVDATFSADENRISAPISELNGSILLEHIGEDMCHVMAINVKGNELCKSRLISSTHGTDLSSLQGCITYKKSKSLSLR